MPKPKSPRQGDRHKSGFLVRLPEEYRAKLAELRRKTGQPYTYANRKAMDAYLAANGVEPPGTSTS